LQITAEDGEVAGRIRAELAHAGTPIGPYDVLIAGHVRARGATLVSNNTREFGRVEDLAVVDWTE
jgi:tRNA(fMet)-specific endonuclease VapC